MNDHNTAQLLNGKNAIIMGGAGAIGVAAATALLQDGACVTLVDSSEKNLQAAADKLGPYSDAGGGQIRTFIGDATDEQCVQRAVALAAGRENQLAIAVAVIGGGPPGLNTSRPLIFLDAEDFERTLAYNVTPAFLLLKYAGRLMLHQKGGSIVVISSIAAVLSAPLMGAYSIGKAALDTLVRVAADELGSSGVRVNAVRPGFTLTQKEAIAVQDSPYAESYLAQQAIKRIGAPEDIGSAIRFLAGPESSWITGQCLNVDGGISLHRIPKREQEIIGQPIPDDWKKYLG